MTNFATMTEREQPTVPGTIGAWYESLKTVYEGLNEDAEHILIEKAYDDSYLVTFDPYKNWADRRIIKSESGINEIKDFLAKLNY